MRTPLALVLVCAGTAVSQPAPPQPLDGNPAVSYPAEALRRLVTGEVTFRAAVSAEGTVEDVIVLEVPDRGLGFEEVVVDAVRRWRFEPARNEGGPVASYYLGRVPFSLRPDDEDAIRVVVERVSRLWTDGDAAAFAGTFHPYASILAEGHVLRGRDGARQWLEGSERAPLGHGVRKVVFSPGAHATVFLKSGPELSMNRSEGEWLVVSWVSSSGEDDAELPETLEAPPPALPRGVPEKGVVVLQVLIDHEGFVRDVEVVGSVPGLDDHAVAAVREWRFRAARRAGVAVPIVMTLTVGFEE